MNPSILSLPDPPSPVAEHPSLVGMTPADLAALVSSLGEPAFRARQLHHWIYVKCVRDFADMTDLAKGFREKLASSWQVGALSLSRKEVSKDGTIKYLFRLADGTVVESVLMHFKDRNSYSICMSSQVGCAVDCGFCATGKLGFKRNLTVAEIVDQYLYVQSDSGQEVRNIVFMGQGEPLLNYDNVLAAIRILNQSAEVGIRHITLSTSGIVTGIQRLAEENLQLVLAVSLHAPDNETRDRFMPINRKWPVEVLMAAVRDYIEKTGRRVTLEYVLLAGVNDSRAHAQRLGQLTKGLKCNINLIPYNPIGEAYEFRRPDPARIQQFQDILSGTGKKVTVRMERGTDIAAACGQLANLVQQKQ